MSDLPLNIHHATTVALSLATCLDCPFTCDAATWTDILEHINGKPAHKVTWTTSESRTSVVAASVPPALALGRRG